MKFSVVIPTYNRAASLKRVIGGLEQQTYPNDDFEVVIVSDGSSDGTNAYLEQLQTPLQVVPCYQANGGAAAARNRGVYEAHGEIILFLDDDVVPAPNLIEEHACLFHDMGTNIVVLGPMLSPPDFKLSPWVAWEQRMLLKQYDAMANGKYQPTSRQFFTGNSSVARQAVLDAGGFNPSYQRAEDVELAYRLEKQNVRFLFNPNAIGYHYAERSYASWNATPYAYGKNDVLFHEREGNPWLLSTMQKEFQRRNVLVRSIVRLCLSRTNLSRLVTGILKQVALLSHQIHLASPGNMAFSGIFNLRYYQGAADQLGGRKVFYQRMSGKQ